MGRGLSAWAWKVGHAALGQVSPQPSTDHPRTEAWWSL